MTRKGGNISTVQKKLRSRTGLFKRSVLIYYTTKLSGFIYRAFLSGFFGWLLTSYDTFAKCFASSKIIQMLKGASNYKAIAFVRNAKRYVAMTYERSFFLNQIRGISTRILTARANTFGLFFFSYGFYLVLIQLIKRYVVEMQTAIPHTMWIGAICMIGGFFLLFSKKNVAAVVYESRILHAILFDFFDLRIVDVANAAQSEVRKGFNIPFFLSMLLGVLSIFIDPLLILKAIILFALLSLIFSSPESGIITIFLTIPFLETMQLAALLILVFISYVLKLICGRRVLRFHLVDFSVLAFLAFVFFGGIHTVDASSFQKMLLLVCFMSGYFVVKNIISSPALVRRCLHALVLSAAIVSFYGIYQNYFGVLSTIWQDTSVFADIKGRVVSTFDNPNVLGEYLILVFPITVAMMANAKKANERFLLLICACANCACLLFTWSRGAWIGFALSMVIFLCVSSRYFFTAGILSIPVIGTFAAFKIDSSIIRRITSFGDSSTSYRLGIWEGVIHMLEEVGTFGIGIGEGAFARVYPIFAMSGIETAPHSHNLYLQIAVETGYFSLLVFFVFVFSFVQCSFSFCKNAMNRSNKLICLGIVCGVLAFLMQGVTDYVWYNYRIFLLFWLVVGLGVAHIYTAKNTDEESEVFYY